MAESRIDWTDDSWNPVTGCTAGCPYCYARRLAARMGDTEFRPQLHEDRLKPYRPKAAALDVFLVSMGDLWDPDVLDAWRARIWPLVAGSQHRYLVLTKRPDLIANVPDLGNLLVGVTVTSDADAWRIAELCDRVGARRFVSFEPLHGDCAGIELDGLDWLVIGAETRDRRTVRWPEKAWVEDLTERADRLGIPVFHKENLGAMATRTERARCGLTAPTLF